MYFYLEYTDDAGILQRYEYFDIEQTESMKQKLAEQGVPMDIMTIGVMV
jgi:hypothetical protein